MIAYRPKTLFQKNTQDRAAFQTIAGNDLLHRAISAAQAEMAFAGFGPHEMRGVSAFILILLNLSETEEAAKPLPTKPLVSFDAPLPPSKPNTETR